MSLAARQRSAVAPHKRPTINVATGHSITPCQGVINPKKARIPPNPPRSRATAATFSQKSMDQVKMNRSPLAPHRFRALRDLLRSSRVKISAEPTRAAGTMMRKGRL